jgi:hypothetical protein
MIILLTLVLFPPCHLFLLYIILLLWAIVDELIKYIIYFIKKFAVKIICVMLFVVLIQLFVEYLVSITIQNIMIDDDMMNMF